MRKHLYSNAILLIIVFISSCHPDKSGDQDKSDKRNPPAVILSLQQIKDQFAPLTAGQAIDAFNELRQNPQSPPLARETLDNYVKALLIESAKSIGNAPPTFQVNNTAIAIEEGPKKWKEIYTDAEDRRAMLNWAIDGRLGASYHFFVSGTKGIKSINSLEQAVLWDDLAFIKGYFEGGTVFRDSINNKDSTPLAFANSAPMAQVLLEKGADPKAQVRTLKNKDGSPMSVLDYLTLTNAPKEVLDLVKAYKK